MLTPLRQRIAAATSGLPRVFWTVWWGLIVNRLASFVLAFLSIYLVRERGFSPAEAGRVLALYGAGMTVAGPLGGLLADRIGRRANMLVALVLGSSSVAALAFARDPALLAALAFLSAASGDLYRPAMSAAVADVVPPIDRPRAYGIVTAGGGILAHPKGAAAGVEAMQQAWQAAVAGVPLDDFARTRPNLRQALEMAA